MKGMHIMGTAIIRVDSRGNGNNAGDGVQTARYTHT